MAQWELTGLGLRGQSDPAERLDSAESVLTKSPRALVVLLMKLLSIFSAVVDRSGSAAGGLVIRALH